MNIESQPKSGTGSEFQGNPPNNTLNSALKGGINQSALNFSGNALSGALSDGSTPSFKTELEEILSKSASPLAEYNIEDILADMDIIENVNIESVNVDKADALFFINVLGQAGITNYTMSNDGALIDGLNYKSIEVSKTLSNLLMRANETKKAVRLDFDNNVTVILKMTNGKLSANFIPGDKAVEEYLKNNIPYLKQRFDEQNIPYANLTYKEYGQGQRHRQRNDNDGGNNPQQGEK